MILTDAIALVQTQGGFDTTSSSSSDTVIRGWINEAVQEAVARAKSRRKSVSLGVTVASQSQYAIPTEVVRIKMLRVNGSRPWLRIGTEDLWKLEGNDARLDGAPGAYAPENETDADSVVELWPVPTVAGYAIEAHAAVLPDAIAAGTAGATVLPIPEDLCGKVLGGAIAIGLERVHERADLAQPFRAGFELAVQEMGRRANSRVGAGPTQIRPG